MREDTHQGNAGFFLTISNLAATQNVYISFIRRTQVCLN
jgi:hypothetical protein